MCGGVESGDMNSPHRDTAETVDGPSVSVAGLAVPVTIRQSPRRSIFPRISSGKNRNRATSIRTSTRTGFLSCRLGLPGFANNQAITDDAAHNDGVMWRILIFLKPAPVNTVSSVSDEKCTM